MSKHPNRAYGVNPETLLVLAWCSTLDLRAMLEKDQQERSWKYPHLHNRQDWRPVFPAGILHTPITAALACFRDDQYGPALRSLVDYRLLFVDVEQVADTLSLEDLAEPSHALFSSDDAFEGYTIRQQRAKGPANETDTFWQAVSQHAVMLERLQQLSETWQHSVCQGAQALQTFFSVYPRLSLAYQDAPFFVRELLFMSLERINWHIIAANLLLVESSPCTCKGSKKEDSSVQIALFEELLRMFDGALCQVSELLPEPQRGIALFLSDFSKRAGER